MEFHRSCDILITTNPEYERFSVLPILGFYYNKFRLVLIAKEENMAKRTYTKEQTICGNRFIPLWVCVNW